MSVIHRVHWAQVKSCQHAGQPGKLFAFWPDIVPFTQTLAEAGMVGFEDADSEWNKGLMQMIRSLGASLKLTDTAGLFEAATQSGESEATAGKTLALAAHGNPILWVWLPNEQAGTWHASLRSVAAGRPLEETKLDWEQLLPERFR